jgi:hypothetical protein
MKPQRPKRWDGYLSNTDLEKSVDCVHRVFAKNESKIKYSAYHFIG